MAFTSRYIPRSSLSVRALRTRSYSRRRPFWATWSATGTPSMQLRSSWHHPRCKWVRHDGPIQTAPRDKNCSACQEEEAAPHHLTQRELLWQRQMQHMQAILERDPYEALFGFSNRLLRGQPFPPPSVGSSTLPWWLRGEGLTPENVYKSAAAPAETQPKGPQPDPKSQGQKKDVEPSPTPENPKPIPAQQAGEIRRTQRPIVQHTTIIRDSVQIEAQTKSSTSQEMQFDPISMRMVPKATSSMTTALQARAPNTIIKAEKDTVTRAIQPREDVETSKISGNETSSSTPKVSTSSAPVTLPRETKPRDTAKVSTRAFDFDGCDPKDCIDDYNFQVLKANSITPAGRKAAFEYCKRSIESLDPYISQSRGALALLTSSRASNWHGKRDLLRFLAAKVHSDFKMSKKTKEMLDHLYETKSVQSSTSGIIRKAADGSRIGEVSKTRKQLEQSWAHDIGTKAKGVADSEPLKMSSWPSGQKHDAVGKVTRKAMPEKQWKEKVPSKVLVFPLVEKEKPLAQMSISEIEKHRQKLFDSWKSKHTTPSVKDTDKLLSLEIEAQKAAMAAYESRRAEQNEDSSIRAVEAVVPGEGDVCSNAPNFAQSGRMYKCPAPHALRVNEQQEADQALVNDVRAIYENSYGKIDENHVQGKANINSNDSARPTSNSRRRDTTLYKVLAYDPANQSIYTANATSTYTPPTGEKCLAVSDALARLQAPAKFLPLLADHQENGYEIVSASKHLLVLKCVHADSASAVAPKPGSSRPRFSSGINPIDPTIQTLKMNPPLPQVGNFASPTGFVNHDYPYTTQPTSQKGLPKSEPTSPSASSSNPIVRKEEPVFSGSQTPRSRAWQAEFDKAYRKELRRSAKRAARAEHQADVSEGHPEVSHGFASKWFKAYDEPLRHRFRSDGTIGPRSRYANGRHSFRSLGFWGRLRRILRRVVLLVGWTAACAYAAGVVMEYFRTGGSGDRDERGWGQDLKGKQKSRSLESGPKVS